MSSVERTVLVVDNALPAWSIEERGPRVLIGGDNDAGEFSAFDRAVQFIGSDIWRYDFVHFATSAFNMLYVGYLGRFDAALLDAVAGRPVCLGHIDCYNDAVEILGVRTQHWIRSCFFLLPPADVRTLGSFVTIGRSRFSVCTGNAEDHIHQRTGIFFDRTVIKAVARINRVIQQLGFRIIALLNSH